MGFDAEYFNDIDDDLLIEKALCENRILLTRDTGIKIPPDVGSIFIKDDHWFYQVRQVLMSLPEKFPLKPFRRCILCNVETAPVSREDVEGQAPPYVYSTQKNFSKCPACGKIYWEATHSERMKESLKLMVEGTGFEIEGEEFTG